MHNRLRNSIDDRMPAISAALAAAMVAVALAGCAGGKSAWWTRAKREAASVSTAKAAPAPPPPAVAPVHLGRATTSHPEIRRLPPVEAAPPGNAPAGTIRLVTLNADAPSPGDKAPTRPPELLPAQARAAAPARTQANKRNTPESTQAAAQPNEKYPIDLANALALGGAGAVQIQLAREKVIEAESDLLAAKALWLPNLRVGLGYNKHDGRIQATPGQVIEANRNSLFVGGGAGLGNAPLTGGAGGPPRLMVNLSLADAAFEPLVACQLLQAQEAAADAAFNNTLLAIATGYYDLVEAHGRLANARAGLKAAERMLSLAQKFERQGFSSKTEISRAETELGRWRETTHDAQRRTVAASAELVRLLRLDPQLKLVPVESKVLPVEVIDDALPLAQLLEQGWANRPEMAQHEALVDAAIFRNNQEHWRPWLPSVQAGASAGSFGGGPSTTFPSSASRSDVDLLAVWEVRNLGFGTAAMRRREASQMRQAEHRQQLVRDHVAAEIVTARGDVTSFHRQIRAATAAVAAAARSYDLNEKRIRQGEGHPLELLQAIRARGEAQDNYTAAVANYNRAQYRLLRALGHEPAVLEKAPADAAP